MEKKTLKRYLKLPIKLAVSLFAIWMVYNQIDIDKALETLERIRFSWMLLAITLFLLSQFISSVRLRLILSCIQIKLDLKSNFYFYLKGMFYNLFLPGGIAGDGYKVIVLKSNFEATVKKVSAALLFDRLIGLIGLSCLFLILFFFIQQPDIWLNLKWLIFPLLPISYSLTKSIFPSFNLEFNRSLLLSIIIQLLQLLTVLVILLSLNINDSIVEYLSLFLLSSVISVLPLSIGGIGLRELTFVLGAGFFHIDQEIAVLLAFLFFMISSFISLFGIFPTIRLSNSSNSLVN